MLIVRESVCQRAPRNCCSLSVYCLNASDGGIEMLTPLFRHGVKVLSAANCQETLMLKWSAVAVLVGLACLLALSCDESTAPRHLPYGTVEGYLLGGGQPAVTNVELAAVEPEQEEGRFRTVSDVTGWYSLRVPVGRYVLRLASECYYAHAGLVEYGDSADTLVVTEQPQRIDIAGAAARLTVNVPTALRNPLILAQLGICNSWLGGSPHHVGTWNVSMSFSGTVREFHFPFMQPGAYLMRLDYGGGPVLWLPPSLDPADADTFQLGTAATETFTITVPEPVWISGEITGSWQQSPHTSPIVLVFDPDSTLMYRGTFIWRPEYHLVLPMAAPVKLGVDIQNRVQWIGGHDFSSATLFDPEPGEEITGANLVESGIACHMEWPEASASYSARCQLYDQVGAPLPIGWTEEGNTIFLSNLRPGTYFLHFELHRGSQFWHSQWYDGAESLAAATPITISVPGEVVQITAHLH
jgi:hypothetical protein